MLPKAVIIGGGIIGVIILLGIIGNQPQSGQKKTIRDWFADTSPSPSPKTMIRDWFQDENGSSVEISGGNHAIVRKPNVSSILPATVTVVRENGAVSIATISANPKNCRDANTCSADLVPSGTADPDTAYTFISEAPANVGPDRILLTEPGEENPVTTTRPSAAPSLSPTPRPPVTYSVIKITVIDKDGNIVTDWPKPTPKPTPAPKPFNPWDWIESWFR